MKEWSYRKKRYKNAFKSKKMEEKQKLQKTPNQTSRVINAVSVDVLKQCFFF